MRRGIALKSLKRYEHALKDFENVLKYAPGNKRAKTLHAEVIKTLKETGGDKNQEGKTENSKRGKKLLIEEVESLEEKKKEETNVEENKVTNEKKKGRRMKIIEVDNMEDSEILDKSSENQQEEKLTNGHSTASGQSMESKTQNDAEYVENENPSDASGSIIADEVDKEAVSEKQSLVSEKRTKEMDIVTESADEPVAVSAMKAEEEINVVVESKAMKEGDDEIINSEPPPILPNPSPPIVPLPDDVLSLKDKGNAMYKAGKYADAKKKYTDAISRLKGRYLCL